MIPLRNPTYPAEILYNESQIRTRNPIERSYGVWKRRFPILAKGISLKLNTAMAVVVACAVLHNIANINNDPVPNVDKEIEKLIIAERLREERNLFTNNDTNQNENAIKVRKQLILYFNRL